MSQISIYSDLPPKLFGVRLRLNFYKKKGSSSGSPFGADSGSKKNAVQQSTTATVIRRLILLYITGKIERRDIW
jgi:hypothetical protein